MGANVVGGWARVCPWSVRIVGHGLGVRAAMVARVPRASREQIRQQTGAGRRQFVTGDETGTERLPSGERGAPVWTEGS